MARLRVRSFGLLLVAATLLPALTLAHAAASPLADEPATDSTLVGPTAHAASRTSVPVGARVVLVVRHGETQADGSGDPPLSAAGMARAVTLARIAASYDVESAFATPFRRTLGTATPAAEWLGLQAQAVAIPPAGIPAHVSTVAARVRASDGAGVLVVGHSNTVPAIVEALTGIDVGPIAETEYDRLFIVVLPAEGPPTVEERSY